MRFKVCNRRTHAGQMPFFSGSRREHFSHRRRSSSGLILRGSRCASWSIPRATSENFCASVSLYASTTFGAACRSISRLPRRCRAASRLASGNPASRFRPWLSSKPSTRLPVSPSARRSRCCRTTAWSAACRARAHSSPTRSRINDGSGSKLNGRRWYRPPRRAPWVFETHLHAAHPKPRSSCPLRADGLVEIGITFDARYTTQRGGPSGSVPSSSKSGT